jgi:hypothetical protein
LFAERAGLRGTAGRLGALGARRCPGRRDGASSGRSLVCLRRRDRLPGCRPRLPARDRRRGAHGGSSAARDGLVAAGLCEPPSEAALASVSAQSARDLRRLRPLRQRCDPLIFADGLSMDGVLEPLEERFELVDPLLQDFNAPLMPRSRRLGGRARGPPAATQLDDTAEDRRATPHGPTRIAGARHRRKPPTASFS